MKRLTVISLLLLAGLLLSACSASTNSTSWPGLAADQNNAYLASGQFVYAVRLSDGAKLWQYPAQAATEEFFSNPVLTPDGQLLVGSSGRDYALYSLDPATGASKWGAPFTATDHWVASPLVVGDTVYAPNNNGTLYALKLTTGQMAWSLPIGRSLWGAPTTDGKLIFVASLDHFLYAVDPNAHKIVWKTDLGGSIPGSPLVASDGGSLYLGSFARKVFAVDAATGAVRWTSALKDWAWSTPALMGDSLFAADISGNLYSLATASGKNAWPEVKPDGPITGSPVALAEGVAVVTDSGFLYAYKPDGSTLWPPVNIGGKIYTSPVVSGDRIIIAPMGATYWLYAVNGKDGSVLPWHFAGK
ncbi:MAG TPA: PQQ-binding-like beta-propeller repeat protein [Anaerolineales bacterium]